MSYLEEMKRTQKAKKSKDNNVYIVIDHDGDLVAENVIGRAKAKKLAEMVYGHYERQY